MEGKEGLRARWEAVPSDEAVAVLRGEMVNRHVDLVSQTRRTREVDHEIRETRDCRRWRRGGCRWSRRGRQ